LSFTHLFSSHLQRAAKTVGKIREAQLAQAGEVVVAAVPDVVQVPLLVEQNFGSMEGKKSYERPPESKLTGKERHRAESKGTAGFVDVESKDAMAQRADSFLDMHLMPLLDDTSSAAENCVAIVSHGIFLSTLWKRLLLRLPAKSVVLCPKLQATARPSLEHLGGWSNTGYLELDMTRPSRHTTSAEPPSSTPAPASLPAETPATNEGLREVGMSQVNGDEKVIQKGAAETSATTTVASSLTSTLRIAHDWKTTILTINGKDHLKGLKRTGGGVGSSRYDTSQKRIDTFFKRRKVE
jgi:broad specificity phosphatase PhoE